MNSATVTRVIIESPLRAKDTRGEVRNWLYAMACLEDSLRRGEAPFASHLLYPLVLDDHDAADREMGIDRGFAWRHGAQLTAVYTDLGVSDGMRYGIAHAKHALQPVEFRTLTAEKLAQIEAEAEADTHNVLARGRHGH